MQNAAQCYLKAKELAECLYNFPYLAPTDVPSSVSYDTQLMKIIADTHKTTIDFNGKTRQTTISAAERIQLQGEFKTRIHALLEKCLAEDSEYAPAFLLYPKVAEYNTRAKDRIFLIELFERFLPMIERVVKGSRGYSLIQQDIEGMFGNCFDMVERHIADFHCELAKLYAKEDHPDMAKEQFEKAITQCPQIYGSKIRLTFD